MSTIAVTVHLPIVIIKKTATLSVVISHHRRTRLHQLGRLLLPHILFTVKLPTFLSNQPPSAVCAQPPFTRPTYFPVHLPSSSPFLPPSPLPPPPSPSPPSPVMVSRNWSGTSCYRLLIISTTSSHHPHHLFPFRYPTQAYILDPEQYIPRLDFGQKEGSKLEITRTRGY